MSRDELARVTFGPEPGQSLPGIGSVRFYATCAMNAEEVLSRCRNILSLIFQQPREMWPSLENCSENSNWPIEKWEAVFPGEFTGSFANEISIEESRRIAKLPYNEKVELAKRQKPSILDWLYWLHPDQRNWRWWDARVIGENSIEVVVTVAGWPFPWDDLRWLFIACGAVDLKAEE